MMYSRDNAKIYHVLAQASKKRERDEAGVEDSDDQGTTTSTDGSGHPSTSVDDNPVTDNILYTDRGLHDNHGSSDLGMLDLGSEDYIDGTFSEADEDTSDATLCIETQNEVEETDSDTQSSTNSERNECSSTHQPPPDIVFVDESPAMHPISTGEAFSFELMRMLDKAGSPLYLFDDVMTHLRKHMSIGLEKTDLLSRQILMKHICERYNYPPVEEWEAAGHRVFRFPFVNMLQNLLDTNGSDLYMINPLECLRNDAGRYNNIRDEDIVTKTELWNTSWMADTFSKCAAYKNFDPETEVMLPLIIYIDKTGTDALQRYSLEPVLFTTAAIPREAREKCKAWSHFGFIPPLKANNDEDGTAAEASTKQVQTYHDVLAVLLEGLIQAQKDPPMVTIKKDGKVMKLRARLPVMIVMGDQKSQDTLCGRRQANSGGAGRVHRSCMCSYINVDDPDHICVDVSSDTIKHLTNGALL